MHDRRRNDPQSYAALSGTFDPPTTTQTASVQPIPLRQKPDPLVCRGGCGELLEPVTIRRKGEALYVPLRICDPCRVAENDRERPPEHVVARDRRLKTIPIHLRETRGGKPITFETLDRDRGNARTLELLEQWIPPWGSIFLSGPVGSGKSQALACLVRKLIEGGGSALWTSEQRLMRMIREDFGRRGSTLQREICDAPILVVDDLGAAARTDWERRIFEEILSERSDNRRPILMTSNYSLDDLRALYSGAYDERNQDPIRGDRIMSRLSQMIGNRQWAIHGRDRRARR